MVQAYNFLASWQLFPEKGIYEYGERPKSGTYRISAVEENKTLRIDHNWVSLENEAYHASYLLTPDGHLHNLSEGHLADTVQALFPDGITFEIHFYKKGEVLLHVVHEILPNGYLKITQQGKRPDATTFTNSEIFHKQMSVLPYAASVAGAIVKPTEEGVVKHKALTAMEEQTNMQLVQIRRQIELLALQAQEIQKRKDLSMTIYNARISFAPVIGQTYHLYQKSDDSYLLSLIAPKEWGNGSGPFKRFVASVRLLADHTWVEI